MNDKDNNSNSKDNSFSEAVENLLDDFFAPTTPHEAPDSKKVHSPQDKPSDKTVQKKVRPKKPLNKKTTPSLQPSRSKPPIKKDTPITKKKSPPKDASKTPTQEVHQKTQQKIKETNLREKPKKSLNHLIFALLIVLLVILSMFTGKILDYDGVMDFLKIKNSSTPIPKPVSIHNTNKKIPSHTEDLVESKIEISNFQGPDMTKEEAVKSNGEISHPYSIYLGSYNSITKVKKASSDYTKMEIPCYWIKLDLDKKGVWFRLFAGYFQTREEADEFIKTWQIQGAESRITKYANLIGIYTSKEDIDKHKALLEELEYSPYIIRDTEDVYRLYVGAFYQKDRAEEQNSDLALKGIQSEIVER